MASDSHIELERVRLYFTKTHCVLYRRLSLNILREVGRFLNTCFLAAVQLSGAPGLRLHNLSTGTSDAISLEESLPCGVAYCALDNYTLFYVGGLSRRRAAKRVDLRSGAVTREPLMNEDRWWPGIIAFDSRVFVFGGNSEDTLKSCEAFSLAKKQWTQCPDMKSAKVAFTPVEHRRDIYLPAPQRGTVQLEVFTPASLEFRLLPLSFRASCYGSVSLIFHGELIVFTYGKQILAWSLDSRDSKAQVIGELQSQYSGLSNGRPARVGNWVYWPNSQGSLVKFNLRGKVLSEPK